MKEWSITITFLESRLIFRGLFLLTQSMFPFSLQYKFPERPRAIIFSMPTILVLCLINIFARAARKLSASNWWPRCRLPICCQNIILILSSILFFLTSFSPLPQYILNIILSSWIYFCKLPLILEYNPRKTLNTLD